MLNNARRVISFAPFLIFALILSACGGSSSTRPEAVISVELASSKEATFSASGSAGSGLSYTWRLEQTDGDYSDQATGVSFAVSLPEPGSYTLSLTITDAEGRSDSETRTITNPLAPSVISVGADVGKVTVSWDYPDDPSIQGFIIQRKVAGGSDEPETIREVSAAVRSIEDTDVSSGQDYLYFVIVIGESGFVSEPISINDPVQPNPVNGQRQLRINRNTAGRATITSTPTGINCDTVSGTGCTAFFPPGTEVRLTVVTQAGTTFEGWDGCDEVSANQCSVTLNEDKEVSVDFTQVGFTLSVAKSGVGQGIITSIPEGISCGDGGEDCSETFLSGDIIVLRARPGDGSLFNRWQGDCSGGSCRVTIEGDTSVTGVFSNPENDRFNVTEGETLSVGAPGLLENDSAVADSGLQLVTMAPEGPAHGELTLNADGSFSYAHDGGEDSSDSFSYTVRDRNGNTARALVNISIAGANDRPTASDISTTVAEGSSVEITLSASDPDGDSLTYRIVEGPDNGSLSAISGARVTYTPDEGFDGTDTFQFVANDGEVDSNTATVTIRVDPVGSTPVVGDDSYTTDEDEVLEVGAARGVLANDVDGDGDTLTARVETEPEHGSLELDEDGSFTYTPDEDFSGSDSFMYRASDGDGVSERAATVSITVNERNDAPVTEDDAYEVREDTTLTVSAADGVLDNDSDPDSSELSAEVVSEPVNGSLTLNEDGSFTYRPDEDFSGSDSFTYRASDGDASSAPATVSITVTPVNDAPSATDVSVTVAEEGSVEVTLRATDPDGDSLTYRIVDGPDNGTLSAVSGARVTYTPEADFDGRDSFQYVASDGTEDSNRGTVTITVTPEDDPPTISGLSDTAINEDGSASIDFSVNDPDGPNGAISVSATSSNTALLAAGDIEISGGGGGRTLVAAPAAQANGTTTITVTATDRDGLSASDSFVLTVRAVNDAPSFTPSEETIERSSGETATPVTISGWVTGLELGPPNESGQSVLDYTVTDLTNPGLFAEAPSVSTDGTLSFTLAPEADGVSEFDVVLRDDGGTLRGGENSFTAPVSVSASYSPSNRPPVAVPQTEEVNEDGTIEIDLDASDPDGDTLSFSVTDAPDNGTLSTLTGGAVTYTPDADYFGPDSFTYRASDGSSSDTATVSITVRPVNDAPLFIAEGPIERDSSAEPEAYSLPSWAVFESGAPNETQAVERYRVSGVTNPSIFDETPEVADDGTLSFTFAPGASGSSEFDVTVQDDGGTARGGEDTSEPQTFVILATPPAAQAPTVSDIADTPINEDGSASIDFSVNDPDGPNGAISVSATSSNTALLAAGDITFTGSGGSRTLTATPAAQAFGTTTVTVTVTDGDGLSASDDFILTVRAVNDAPSFLPLEDPIDESSSAVPTPVTIPGWVTAIEFGPPNESGQSVLGYTTSNVTNPGIFTVEPSVSLDGTLSFTLAAGADDFSEFDITLRDSGGTARGGENSFTGTFLVSVTPSLANTPPTAVDDSGAGFGTDEDSTFITADVLANDSDSDGDSLSIVAFDAQSTLGGFVAPAIGGTFNYLPSPGLQSLAEDESALDSFDYTVADPSGARSSARVELLIVGLNDVPVDILLSNTVIDEGADEGAFVGSFETLDPDGSDSHSYDLVSGLGDSDNSAFQISGADLLTDTELDFEDQNRYSIRVRSDDSNGGSFEKSFIIDINAVDELVRLGVDVVGEGRVTSTPVGIDCGALCEAEFAEGASVTLRADAGEGYGLQSWSVEDCGRALACAFDLISAQTVTAFFEVSAVTDLRVRPKRPKIAVGQTRQLNLSVEVQGSANDGVSWMSEDSSVVIVDDSGVILGVAEGRATVTATSVFDPGVSDTVTVRVEGDSDMQTL